MNSFSKFSSSNYQGMPFCVAGMGDLLALFRCISCRFNFGADPAKPEILGAPGRVYTTGKPELACNVQQYSRQSYLRRAEAEQCRVQSSMLLPVFSIPPDSNKFTASVALGVVEVVQTSDDMDFLPVARLLGTVLIKCGLYTSSLEEVVSRLPTAATNLQLPNRTGLLEDEGGNDSSEIGDVGSAEDDTGNHQQQQRGQEQQQPREQEEEQKIANNSAGGGVRGDGGNSGDTNMRGSDDLEDSEEEDDNDDGDDYEPGRPAASGRGQRRRTSNEKSRTGLRKSSKNNNTHSSAGTDNNNGRYRHGGGGGYRNPKSGVKLTLADLQGQFGVGLKEAATQLGVCTTTLKRACRRHGIQRWPRRALQKVSRTLDEMERRGTIQNSMAEAVPMGSLMHPTTGQFMIPPPPLGSMLPFDEMPVDLRWAALANMIPKLNGAGGGGPFTIQTGPGNMVLPSPSDFSLEGAVTMTQGGNGNNGKNKTTYQNNKDNKGDVVTAGTGMTSGWDQVGTAAGAAAAAAAAAAAGQQPLAQINIPPYLRNGQRATTAAKTVEPRTFESPFDNHPLDPVLQLPGGGATTTAPSVGPAMSFPFSQMSLPSFGPSFMVPSSLLLPEGATNGSRLPGVPGAVGGTGGGHRGSGPIMDDIGLLDSTILELMLAEDSRTLVGASDEELKRMFPTSQKQQQAQPLK
jgi:RWP-RK domain